MEEDYYHNYSDTYDDYDYLYPVLVLEDTAPQEGRALRISLVVVYSLICFLGILGNSVVIVVATFKMKRTANTVWFVNLAVADFLFNLFLPLHITYVALDYHWVFGQAMCKINNFLLNHNMYTSVFLLTAISFDRCLSVALPVWSQNHRGVRLAYSACLFIWALAFFLSCPALVFRDTVLHNGKIACFNNFSLSASPSSQGPAHATQDPVAFSRHMLVTVTRFLFGFLIPVIIISTCYAVIICKLRRNRLAKTKKPLKVIVTIIVTFFLCWCPYHTLNLLEVYRHTLPSSVLRLGFPLAITVAIANSCVNPILYVFMGQDFKKLKLALFSRLVNALSEDTGHSSYHSHRSFTKMSSVNERSSANEQETNML